MLGQLGQENTNNWGDGGLDALNPIDLGTGRTAVAIAAGGYHSCAVLDDGTAKCWGANASGNLGQGDTATRGDGAGEMGDNLDPIELGTGRTAIAVAAGLEHSCAMLDDGTAKCWGENGAGQLGLDSTSDRGERGRTRWATTSTRSTSAPVALPLPSPAGSGTPARCRTAGP